MGEAAKLLNVSGSDRYTKVTSPSDVARLYGILRENHSFSDALAVKRKGIEIGHNAVMEMACETLVTGEHERALSVSLDRSYCSFSEEPTRQEVYSALEAVCKTVGREISRTELGAATIGVFEYVSDPAKRQIYDALAGLDRYLEATRAEASAAINVMNKKPDSRDEVISSEGLGFSMAKNQNHTDDSLDGLHEYLKAVEDVNQLRAATFAAMHIVMYDPSKSKVIGALDNLGSILSKNNPIEDEEIMMKLGDAYDALTLKKEEACGLVTNTARAMIRSPTDRECHEALKNAVKDRGWSIDDPRTAVGYLYQRLYGEDFREIALEVTEGEGEDANKYVRKVPYDQLPRDVQEQIHLSLLVRKEYMAEDQRKGIIERMQEKREKRRRIGP